MAKVTQQPQATQMKQVVSSSSGVTRQVPSSGKSSAASVAGSSTTSSSLSGSSMINGVIVKPLRKIPDERGCIMHMLKASDKEFMQFGEIYFSTANLGAIKGWHLHTTMTSHYAVVSGMIKLVLYDQRRDSSTYKMIQEVFMGDQNYVLVRLPPGVVNGFKGISATPAIVANCATIEHDPDEIIRIDPFTKDIPYHW